MLQYLFNLTAIWLCSLLLFDIFLKNESYHRYNRLYLLLTMLMGALLPLWHWEDPVIYHTPVGQPLYNASSVQKIIASPTVQATHSINVEQVITIAYLLGAGIALLLLVKDIVLLLGYYRKGHKSKEGRIIIIETGKAHGPFSVFSYVFINSRSQYTGDEWQVLLRHEARHNTLRHIIDLLILQAAKVVFWFHPLIYVYQKRLLLVHEYQADEMLGYEPKAYGKFLIEQALLQTAPVITHSFNRSPIKKRITMLTRKSPKGHGAKLLIALPLTLCCMICFTQSSYSFKHDGKNIVRFKGNKFEFSDDSKEPLLLRPAPGNPLDTVHNHTPGAVKMHGDLEFTMNKPSDNHPVKSVIPTQKDNVTTFSVMRFGAPLKMNGDSIYTAKNGMLLANPTGKEKTLTEYLFYTLSDDLSQLPDGKYSIDIMYPIIDKDGRLVYYENQGVSIYHHANDAMDKGLKKKIDAAITRALDNAPALKPTMENGKAVPSYDAWAFELGKIVVVTNHKASLEQGHLSNNFQ